MGTHRVMQERGDWLMCNCAECEVGLLGESMKRFAVVREAVARPEFVAGRINGRPYCLACLTVRQPATGRPAIGEDGDSPWQQNATRQLEGD
jgi:hypothetical protein